MRLTLAVLPLLLPVVLADEALVVELAGTLVGEAPDCGDTPLLAPAVLLPDTGVLLPDTGVKLLPWPVAPPLPDTGVELLAV